MQEIITYNFSAGPAMLPVEVMTKAEKEFRDYMGSGMSIMEVSHRGTFFMDIMAKATSNLKSLLDIPDNYSILFFPGGATLQFSAVPMNLMKKGDSADYAVTGVFAKKGYEEAKRLYNANIIKDTSDSKYSIIPEINDTIISPNAKYVYITSNNTIFGTRYKNIPKITKVPLVADMTSELLSRKLNVSDFGLIFAGAQKNIGPSGLTIVIIRKDLLNSPKEAIPVLMDYKVYEENKSLYNTPPTYPIYIANLVFEWCKQKGGLGEIEKINEEKAKLLYDFIDSSKLYYAPIKGDNRSTMNVVFHLHKKELEKEFIDQAEKNYLHGLPGHRDAGGLRASIYNAMPREGIVKLINFMREFEGRKY